MIFEECFPKNERQLFSFISPIVGQVSAILAGGTALALQLGHRISVDLDFFTSVKFQSEKVVSELRARALTFQLLSESSGMLLALVNGVKFSLFEYEYPFICPTTKYEGLTLAGVGDIAAMKVLAISQRGCRRDFVDLYTILQVLPFSQVATCLVQKFGAPRLNPIYIGKSLVYFHDAEIEPDSQYITGREIDWRKIKRYFVGHATQIVRELGSALIK